MTKALEQREVKDRLFKWMFEDKENAIKLVNDKFKDRINKYLNS